MGGGAGTPPNSVYSVTVTTLLSRPLPGLARMRHSLAILAVGFIVHGPVRPVVRPDFPALVSQLSEGPGFFPSDNLVSNETSYLHVIGTLRERGIKGGAYVGVGPEQGFSYIAEIRPEIAFIVDIRRDNLLLHLLLKAIFSSSANRLEYLCLLFGRPVPPDLHAWTDRPLTDLLGWIDSTPVSRPLHERSHRALMAKVTSFGVPLSTEDRATIRRFHDEFATTGLELRYTNRGRSFRPWFPSIRDIYLATDLTGAQVSYLATEDRWRIVRAMEREDLIIPVVGDLAGPKALREIGRYLTETGRTVSAFYLSNVESYLFRGGTFPAFVANVKALPTEPRSVLIRSWFGRGAGQPAAPSGHLSTQQVHTVARFLQHVSIAGDQVSYWGVANDATVENPPVPPGR